MRRLALIALLAGGCGTTAAAVERDAAETKRACITTLPTKPKLVSLADPERLAYMGRDGEAHSAMRLTVDAESAAAFFNYVESLEKIAKRALGCVVR